MQLLECWDTPCLWAGWAVQFRAIAVTAEHFASVVTHFCSEGTEFLFLPQCCTCPGSEEEGSFLWESSLLWRSILGHCRVSSSEEAGILKFCFWSYSITGKGFSAAAVPPSRRASGLTAYQAFPNANSSSSFLGRMQFLHNIWQCCIWQTSLLCLPLSGRSGTVLGSRGHQLPPGDVKGLTGQSAELPSRGLCLPNTIRFWMERAGQMQNLLFTGLSRTLPHSKKDSWILRQTHRKLLLIWV